MEKQLKSTLTGVTKRADGTFDVTLYDATEPDRDGETIAVGSVRAREPLTLQVDHDRSVLKTVGKVTGIRPAGPKLRGRIEFAPPGVSPIADQVRRQVEAGITSKVSIGFTAGSRERRPDGVPVWRDVELVELSFVSVPSSVGAGVDLRGLKSWLHGDEGAGGDRSRGQEGARAVPRTRRRALAACCRSCRDPVRDPECSRPSLITHSPIRRGPT